MAADSLPPLNWLRAFEASARHLSFTGAARELNMTQSAVSQQIKALENYLGRALFVRGTRTLQTTAAGLNYLPTVQEAFATLTAGTRALVGTDRGQVLTLQSNLAFATFWLAPRIGRLLEQNPWLSLSIVSALWEPQRNETPADVDIRFGRALEGQRLERLTNDRCYPVCAPAIAESGADWRNQPLFDCGGVLGNWESWLADQGQSLPEEKTVNFASTYVIALNTVLSGVGLGMAHDTLAGGLLQQGTLVRPFEHSIAMPEAYYLTRPARHAETPASRAFTEWLSAEIGTGER